MNIEFKCPQCGQLVTVDEVYRGQVVQCPKCEKGIVVPKKKTNVEVQKTTTVSKIVHIQCPHCGTKYEATQQDMHRFVSCEICGKNFVAGTKSRKQDGDATQARTTTQTGSQRTTISRPSIAISNATPEPCTRKPKFAIWIITGAVCMVVMLTTAFVLGRHSVKPDSPVKAVTMMRGEDGDNPMGKESDGLVSNEAIGKSHEEIPLGNGVDMAKKEEVTIVQTSNETSVSLSEEKPFESSTKAENKEVATTKNEGETTVHTSSEENTDRVTGTGVLGRGFGGNKLKGKNPLELFRFGDAPRDKLSEKNMVEYEVSGFLGIQKMILRYTTKGHLCSICLVSENDHCSASESDMRVSKLMQLCDEWYDEIKWNVDVQEHDGRKFAIGRINSTSYLTSWPYQAKEGEHVEKVWSRSHRRGAGADEGSWLATVYNYRDMVFSIVPTRSANNVVGLQVNLVDNRSKRLDDNEVDVRHLFKVTDRQYQAAKGWLQDQLKAHSLKEYCFSRDYNKALGLYDYFLCLDWGAGTYIDHIYYVKQIKISLKNGVLRTSCSIKAKSLQVPLADDYAEEIIMARILIAAKELEGVAGSFYDSRGNRGGSIQLPCPICKGDESKQVGECKCYDRGRKRNSGCVSIHKHDFEEEIEVYKSEYKTGRWSPPKQPPRKKKGSEYKPLPDSSHYKSDKEEQAAFAKSKKLVEEQKKYYENQKRDSRRRR